MPVDEIQSYVAKWQAREPEMRVAEAFCPASMRPRFRAWGALLHELRETLFELSDPRVIGVKTGWWAEELMGLEQGRSRHPVTAEFASTPGPWSGLGRRLLAATNVELRPATTEAVIDTLLPVARAVVAVESTVFATSASEEGARALVGHWLLMRLPSGVTMEDRARIPMHLFARHGLASGSWEAGQGAGLLRDWASELLGAMPGQPMGALYRRTRTSFDRARLQRLTAGKGHSPPPAMATLWRAWQAARGTGRHAGP